MIKPGEFYIHNRFHNRVEVLANNPARYYVVVSGGGSIFRVDKIHFAQAFTLDPNQEP